MLSLGRCFLGDVFPEQTFEKIDDTLFIKTSFIEGTYLGIQHFNKNPKQFIADLAKLTVIMVLFRNADMYADNLIVSSDASIHGIDLVECGRVLKILITLAGVLEISRQQVHSLLLISQRIY